jgi:hypothetical protein
MIMYIGAHDPNVSTDALIHRYANRAGILCEQAAQDCNFRQKKKADKSTVTEPDSEPTMPCCDDNKRPACRGCRVLIGHYTGYFPKFKATTSSVATAPKDEDLELEDEVPAEEISLLDRYHFKTTS